MDADIEHVVNHYATLRVLITGSREWRDRDVIRQALLSIASVHGIPARNVTVVHGAARGADSIAAEIAAQLGMVVEPHPADWKTHGKAAGVIRNAEMVCLGAGVCLAFPLGRSVGTQDCMRRARKAGITVIDYGDRCTA
ncbi:MAG TPA: DUF2493 domain-containing protein [Pseudonocardiaceae bacterium]